MNACTGVEDFGVTSATRKNWVSVTETYWGYVIRWDAAWSSRALLIERMCAISGMALMIVGCAHWLFPEVHAAVDSAENRFYSSIGLGVAGLVFLWVAARGLSRETQVDMSLRCVRVVVRNRRGHVRIEKTVPFDKIRSAFVKRPEMPGGAAALYLRLTDGRNIVRIAQGQEGTLEALNRRMTHDLGPARLKIEGWDRVGRKLLPSGRDTIAA